MLITDSSRESFNAHLENGILKTESGRIVMVFGFGDMLFGWGSTLQHQDLKKLNFLTTDPVVIEMVSEYYADTMGDFVHRYEPYRKYIRDHTGLDISYSKFLQYNLDIGDVSTGLKYTFTSHGFEFVDEIFTT